MLDLMRRKKQLRIVLWVVIIGLGLGMILFFIPGANMGGAGTEDTVATVNGDPISVREFWSAYQRMMRNFASGSNIDPQMLRQLGLDRQTLNALINIRVIEYAAQRLGLTVTPREVRRALETSPNFQALGAFIGVERYKALLAANQIDVQEFEEGIRISLLSEKLMNLIGDSLDVTQSELRGEFQRTQQEARVRFALLNKEEFKKRVRPAAAELRAYFEANKDQYHIKEERRARYLLMSITSLASTVEITEQEIQDHWNRTAPQETVTAAHILFSVEDPSQDAAVRQKAEEVLQLARAGEDFAALAKMHSDDTASAEMGGNLGPFPRGRMAREFEDAAFSLQPGQISDLVRTQFGYHIIQVQAHDVPSLERSRDSIGQSLRIDKASQMAKTKAADAIPLREKEQSLEALAKTLGIPAEIRETGFLHRGADTIPPDLSESFVAALFELKEVNSIGRPADIPVGYAVPQLVEVNLPQPPDFLESRAAVEKDYVDWKTGDLMSSAAARLPEATERLGDFEKAARAAGLTVKTSEAFKQDGSPEPDITNFTEFNTAAFTLPVGKVSPPIPIQGENQLAVLQVISRTPFDEAEFQKQKPEIRNRILGTWRNAYFQAYIQRITEDLEKAGKIRINSRLVEQIVAP
ncbi:MAG: SurA N-terminal domain-containing protein [Acidobacteriota bacterium]